MNAERDLVLMSLVIFVPSLAALLILFVPRGKDEWMRWIALFGTAITLVLSLLVLIEYYQGVTQALSSNGDQSQKNRALLISRAEVADMAGAGNQAASVSDSDWLGRRSWIGSFGIDYYLGIDGISLALILLTTMLSFLAMIASWNIERFVRGYCILFLVLETGMLGTFFALDFFLFYIFWEVMLLPMYFLIGIWGGPRREYAAIKFFLYTLLGSVFILIALLGFYFTDIRDFVPSAGLNSPRHSFDLVALQRAGTASAALHHGVPAETVALDALIAYKDPRVTETERSQLRFGTEAERRLIRNKYQADRIVHDNLAAATARLTSPDQPFFNNQNFQIVMFLLLFVGFAIKVPLFPFHTWLPDAHVEAPTPISMILAGVLLKMGGYGIIRIAYPICPWAAEYLAGLVSAFGIINIVYGAFAAMAQVDFKKLVAYSSISHMGYVILGIAVWAAGDRSQFWSWGLNGAMFQMIAHGITSAGMFFLVGVIYDRAHHRNLDNFRGLYEPMPLYGGISAVIFFAAMGLPGMCGFVGEFMVILATWEYSRVYAVLAALTVVITAAYILWTLARVFLGQNPAYKTCPEINLRELICIVPLVVLAVLLGVYPELLMSWMTPDVTGLVNQLARVASLQ
jgi:NADH-quinone oxidoreductase subunit M